MAVHVDDKNVIRSSLLSATGAGADAKAIASAACSHWQFIAACLEPVLGESGTQALHSRCLHLQRVAPANPAPGHPPGEPPGLSALRQHLESRQPAEALDAAVAFFDSFTTLLSSLIGAALTARLLQPVWSDGRTDKPAQETQPMTTK